MQKLSKRLREISANINDIDTLADIGCDHGKLIIDAVLSGKVKIGYAVDISKKSLQKAIDEAKRNNISEKIYFFESDGIKCLPENIDCVVIAGMGGIEIANILSQKRLHSKYILVPHQDTVFLRKYLKNNNYNIEKDYVVEDNKFYDIIVCRHGENNYTNEEIFLGKNIPESYEYDKKNIKRYNTIESIIATIGKKTAENRLNTEIREEWEVLNNKYGMDDRKGL